jgi:hypothetical protein
MLAQGAHPERLNFDRLISCEKQKLVLYVSIGRITSHRPQASGPEMEKKDEVDVIDEPSARDGGRIFLFQSLATH